MTKPNICKEQSCNKKRDSLLANPVSLYVLISACFICSAWLFWPRNGDLLREFQILEKKMQVIQEELEFEKAMRLIDERNLELLRASIASIQRLEEHRNPSSLEELKKEEEIRKREKKHFLAEIRKGCNSTKAVFKNRVLLGWVLSVPDGGEHEIRFLFPDEIDKIKQALERIGTGEDVLYAELLRYLGEC